MKLPDGLAAQKHDSSSFRPRVSAMITTRRIYRYHLPSVLLGLLATASVSAQDLTILPARVAAPSLSGAGEWLNTSGPLDLQALRGKFVVLDFWTYCCINCQHVLPELKEIEREFPKHVAVIGVHSAKFQTERDAQNVLEAIQRHEIEHPVVNDPRLVLWHKYGVDTWPSLRIIDPEGNLVATHEGEFAAESLAKFLRQAIPVYRRKRVLDETPLRFDAALPAREEQPLYYPGKVLADADRGRLFITDTSHNRIVVSKMSGEVLDVIGTGAMGRNDGAYDQVTFDHPQGLALAGDTLYVADTENHLLRKIDLKNRQVTTLAGTGEQSKVPVLRPSSKPLGVKLASPWDLCLHEDDLYIAMAGSHQIWRLALDTGTLVPFAGNALEDIVDGPLLPRVIAQKGTSSFAQPSGLATDGQWLYVADSEGSSIRAVPLRSNREVTTVLGTAHLPSNRLFTFGDRDGTAVEALLQHPLGVAYRDGRLFIADTYNGKVKEFDLRSGVIRTLAGTAMKPFNEPGGLSIAGDQIYVADTNNHAIRVIDLSQDSKITTLELKGLRPPAPPKPQTPPDITNKRAFETATLKPVNENLKIAVNLLLPADYKLNPNAPLRYYIHGKDDDQLLSEAVTGKWQPIEPAATSFEINLPLQPNTTGGPLTLTIVFYYCRQGAEGVCKAGEITWTGKVNVSDKATATQLDLKHAVVR
jgi:DNA-binding beta-propeller fold protein YncE